MTIKSLLHLLTEESTESQTQQGKVGKGINRVSSAGVSHKVVLGGSNSSLGRNWLDLQTTRVAGTVNGLVFGKHELT